MGKLVYHLYIPQSHTSTYISTKGPKIDTGQKETSKHNSGKIEDIERSADCQK